MTKVYTLMSTITEWDDSSYSPVGTEILENKAYTTRAAAEEASIRAEIEYYIEHDGFSLLFESEDREFSCCSLEDFKKYCLFLLNSSFPILVCNSKDESILTAEEINNIKRHNDVAFLDVEISKHDVINQPEFIELYKDVLSKCDIRPMFTLQELELE